MEALSLKQLNSLMELKLDENRKEEVIDLAVAYVVEAKNKTDSMTDEEKEFFVDAVSKGIGELHNVFRTESNYEKIKQTGVVIETTKELICLEKECPFQKGCANHTSAGDHRMEGGFTPELGVKVEGSGEDENLTVICVSKIKSPHKETYDPSPENVDELDQGMKCINRETGHLYVYDPFYPFGE